MTTLPHGVPLSHVAPSNSATRTLLAVPIDRVSNAATEDLSEEWQIQLRSLQQWICELLIKNQQLRRALMEMKKLESIDKKGNV
jgi:hypothetical protein